MGDTGTTMEFDVSMKLFKLMLALPGNENLHPYKDREKLDATLPFELLETYYSKSGDAQSLVVLRGLLGNVIYPDGDKLLFGDFHAGALHTMIVL